MTPEDDLRRQIEALSARVESLEAAIQGRHAPAELPRAAPPSAPPPPLTMPGPPRALSLETRIGAQWLNRVGIAAVLIGMAWFLKLAFDRNWIGPGVRILIGIACSVVLVVWSERFRRQGFPAFSYSLKALGTSIAYLSLWAASSVFHLAPWWLIFAAMTLVTIANAILAMRQNSEVLAVYALAGGLATPGLLSVGRGNSWFLFSYLILLNAGSLLLLARRPWKRLAWAALLGTAGYSIGWTLAIGNPPQLLTTCFVSALFAGFAAVPFLLQPDFSIAFPVVNAAATWVGLMALLGTASRPFATVALALACLVLARLKAEAALCRTHLGLGIFFVTVAIPQQFHGSTVTLCWLGEGLLLLVLARAVSAVATRFFSTAILTLAALALIEGLIQGTQPLATSLVGVAVFAVVMFLSEGKLKGYASVVFGLTLVLAVCLEIHHYWFCGARFFSDLCRGYGELERRSIMAQFGYSACCMIYGAALMTVGFMRRIAFLRWQALALFAFSIGTIFLNGISHQGQGFRVLSFLGLGVLLLVVSFAYQKDWLHLRG